VQDLSVLRARVYLPEFDLRGVKPGQLVHLKPTSVMQELPSRVEAIAPVSSPIEAGLMQEEAYKGITPPQFYAVTALISNPSQSLKPGMTGMAKVIVARRSLAGFAWKEFRDFVQRKVW
jgi:hypothetical protein